MKFGIQGKFAIAFGLLALISISNFSLLRTAEQNASEQQAWVTHTQNVLLKSEAVLGYLRDAETGQRGFLLTQKTEYLEPYNTGIIQAKKVQLTFLVETLMFVASIAIIAFAIKQRLVKPLINLNANTLRMMNGETVNLNEISSNVEIGELITSFYKMSQKIKSTMEDLSASKNEAEEKEHSLYEIIWSANVGTWQWDILTDKVSLNSRRNHRC